MTNKRLLQLILQRIRELFDILIVPVHQISVLLHSEALAPERQQVNTSKLVAAMLAQDLQEAVSLGVEALGCLFGCGVDAHSTDNVDALDVLAFREHGHRGQSCCSGVLYDFYTRDALADLLACAGQKGEDGVSLVESHGKGVEDGASLGNNLGGGF